MPKLQRGTRLVVASHNPGKVREILDLVAPHGLSVVSAGELGLPEPEETGATFAANAELKAVAAAQGRRPAGPVRRFRAGGGGAGRRARHLFGALGRAGQGLCHRHAPGGRRGEARGAWSPIRRRGRAPTSRPRCAWPGPMARRAVRRQGLRPSRVAAARTKGFGYDPMFVPEGHSLTFGEMEPDAKHAISHRARAFQLFASACLGGGAAD